MTGRRLHVGRCGTRRNGVDRDAPTFAQLAGQCVRKEVYGSLANAVSRHAHSELCDHGGKVDDAATARDVWKSSLNDIHVADDIGVKDVFQICRLYVYERRVIIDPGIVDYNTLT